MSVWLIGAIVMAVLMSICVVCKLIYNRCVSVGTYRNSMPRENYVEATFENWLDWFMIAPDKWRFETREYNDYWKSYKDTIVEIPCRLKASMNRCRMGPFIKFSYPDFKKFRKWYKRYKADKAHKAKLEQQESLRQEVNRNTIELLKAVQGDIDSYKAKIDGEMDKAVDTCREITTRIAKEGK